MAATADEFRELIGVDDRVDVPLLRRLAYYGIPNEVRGPVWKLLLPTLSYTDMEDDRGSNLKAASTNTDLYNSNSVGAGANSSSDVSMNTYGYDEINATRMNGSRTDNEAFMALRDEVVRYCARNPRFRSPKNKIQQRMINMLYEHMQKTQRNSMFSHNPGIVHVLGPFVYVMKDSSESDAQYCYEVMLRAIENRIRLVGPGQILGRFLMLLRSLVPQLYVHLEEEELEANKWAVSWLQWLLCRELPFDCCLRLWDAYIAAPKGYGFELHIFVCLAILDTCQTDLIDLEQPELLAFLQHLPTLDMDRILNQAQILYRSVKF